MARRNRDATINWRAPVTTIGIATPADGGPVRDVMKMVWTKKGISPVFDGEQIKWEGENERLTLWFERFVRRAISARSQPEVIRFEIDGMVVDHVTDFLVERPKGSVRLGVKGVTAFAHATWLSDKLDAITRAYAQKGLLFESVTGMDLYRQPLADAVDAIWRARRVRVEAEARDQVLSALACGPLPIADVIAILGPGDPRRALALHAEGAITIDLVAGPIGDYSSVRLGSIDLGSYTGPHAMINSSQPKTNDPTLPGLYEEWPGDPGTKPDDSPPFPMRVGERFRFAGGVFVYKRRTTTGVFYFEPEDGATPLSRSAWRLRIEFAERILVRLERGKRAHPSRAHEAAAAGMISNGHLRTPKPQAWDNRIFIPLIRQEYRRRRAEGLPRLPKSGPREEGGRSEPYRPPRNLAELIANLAEDKGLPVGEQPSWKTVAKTLKEFDHLEVIPADQLVDGRTIAYHPRRTKGVVERTALDVIESEFATRTFESVSGTVDRVNQRLAAENKLQSPEDQLPKIGREAVENLISTLPGMDLCEAKFDRKRARQEYQIVGKLPKPKEPMTIVEFDWHMIDLETRYPAQAKFLGELAGIAMPRLWLIAGIDFTTAWPVGYTWSVGGPSEADIMRAFAHICRYKPSYSHLGAQEWLAGGFMKLLKLDHGKANLAHDVLRAAGKFGIEIVLDEKGRGDKRPNIERFFGFVETDFFSKLPGAVGRSVLVRPERRASPGEMLAVDELDRRFIRWVCNRYANHTARTRTHSPRTAWLNYQKANPGWSPDTASSEEELDRELRVSITKSATREGLVWLDLPYNGIAVQKIRSDHHSHSKGNPKAEMRIHPDHVTDVIIHDPHPTTGGWRKPPEIECLYRDYAPGKSMDVHEIIHNAATKAKKERQKIDEQLLLDTYEAVTRRGVEKVMKRRAPARTIGHVARLGQLMTSGGATPFPLQDQPEPPPTPNSAARAPGRERHHSRSGCRSRAADGRRARDDSVFNSEPF
ncbi:hypothetical protein [Bradyrhizobium sp. RDI18]|uniref:hypothetical protein n=1 Tax=Bradyrhizobium sp. RDI18 TaxID=3367400 RepID=UPI00371143F7